jgi:hypothetical protein
MEELDQPARLHLNRQVPRSLVSLRDQSVAQRGLRGDPDQCRSSRVCVARRNQEGGSSDPAGYTPDRRGHYRQPRGKGLDEHLREAFGPRYM